MSRTPAALASGTLSVGSNIIYTAPTTITSAVATSFVLTNTDDEIKTCDIFINRGTSRLFDQVKIPPSLSVKVNLMTNVAFNSGDILTVTADKANINFDLSGWVVTEDD